MPESNAISMRELQKMSAAKIRAMDRPMPIKSGNETVGMLMPVKRPSVEKLREIEERAQKLAQLRSPEENAAIERFLNERDGY